jgi:hypothetical protein
MPVGRDMPFGREQPDKLQFEKSQISSNPKKDTAPWICPYWSYKK